MEQTKLKPAFIEPRNPMLVLLRGIGAVRVEAGSLAESARVAAILADRWNACEGVKPPSIKLKASPKLLEACGKALQHVVRDMTDRDMHRTGITPREPLEPLRDDLLAALAAAKP
jgi:hypothetical protein